MNTASDRELLQRQIAATDRLVYDLNGLTEEEIAILERMFRIKGVRDWGWKSR
jgi:hypothetical protein